MGSEGRECRYVLSSKLDDILQEQSSKIIDIVTSSITTSLNASLSVSISEELTRSLTPVFTNLLRDSISDLVSKVNQIEDSVVVNTDELKNVSIELRSLKQKQADQEIAISALIAENQILKKQLDTNVSVPAVAEIKELSERIEERTNRQLRQTLIFSGIQEKRFNNRLESWSQTKSVLANVISSTLENCSYDEAYDMINRAHRSAPNNFKRNRRDIYVNMFSWEDCEEIIKAFRIKNVENKNFGVYAAYKYGPLTTKRRNIALKRRSELKAEGKIISGYIKYPALLMAKCDKDGVYEPIEDFSKTEISFEEDES